MKIAVIPDVQDFPGAPKGFLRSAGQYIVEEKPDVIVNIGDFCDNRTIVDHMIAKSKKRFSGHKYLQDVQSAKEAMTELLTPMWQYNEQQRRTKHSQYKPRLEFVLGNHDHYVVALAEKDEALGGLISLDDFAYDKEFGWTVHPFLEPLFIEDIAFVHYIKNPKSAYPMGGTVEYRLGKVAKSFVVGHVPGRQHAEISTLKPGAVLQGLQVGSFYDYNPAYQGPQGATYWRGMVMLHDVHSGMYDPEFISVKRLKELYPA